MFIHRNRIEDVDETIRIDYNSNGIPTELIVAKNRNGPTGICDFVFKPRITKFFEIERMNDNLGGKA